MRLDRMAWARVPRLLLIVVALLCAARGALAQGFFVSAAEVKWPAFPDNGPAVTGIQWGFDGTLSAEEHCPVWIQIAGGADGFQGQVVLEYQQDASQAVRVVVPASAAPNQTSIAEGVVCVPSRLSWMQVILEEPRRRASVRLSQQDAFTSPSALLGRPMVLVVGSWPVGTMRSGNFAALGKSLANEQSTSSSVRQVVDMITTVSVQAGELPSAWIAYESVDVVIVREDDLLTLATPVRQALLAWVHSGGRMVVVLSGAGQRWTACMPRELPADVVVVDDVRPCTLDDELRTTLLPRAIPDRTKNDVDAQEEISKAFARPWPPMPARRMRLTPTGEAMGWKVRWLCSADVSNAVDGLVAQGPAGFGLITLVGVDPARVGATQTRIVTQTLWEDVVGPMLPAKRCETNANRRWWWSSSGIDDQGVSAISSSLDKVVRAKPVGAWVFFVLVGGSVALAMVVGPIGRVVLKRRLLLRRSWLFSLASIGVAGVVALALPALLRSGQRSTSRVLVRDVICDRAGTPLYEARTRLSSLFTDSPSRHRFVDADESLHGGWWRGVSPTYSYTMQETPGERVTLPITPAVGGVLRSSVPMPALVPQWNYRALLGQLPAAAPMEGAVRVWARATSDGSLEVRMRGVPRGALQSMQVVWRGVLHANAAQLLPDMREENDGSAKVLVVVVPNLASAPASSSGDPWADVCTRKNMPLFGIPTTSTHMLTQVRERCDALTVLGSRNVLVVFDVLEESPATARERDVVWTTHRIVLPDPFASQTPQEVRP